MEELTFTGAPLPPGQVAAMVNIRAEIIADGEDCIETVGFPGESVCMRDLQTGCGGDPVSYSAFVYLRSASGDELILVGAVLKCGDCSIEN